MSEVLRRIVGLHSQFIVVPVEVGYLQKAISHQMTLVCSRQVSVIYYLFIIYYYFISVIFSLQRPSA